MKKKLLVFVFVVGLLFSAVTVGLADQIRIGTAPQNGGEYTIWSVSPSMYLFDTFCLEINESFSGVTHYDYTIDDYAYNGGKSGQTLSEPTKDYLDPMTAYLYDNFRHDSLAGFDKTNPADSIALTYVIKFIEDEYPGKTLAAGSKEEYFYDLAEDAVESGVWQGLGDVRVLNPFTHDAEGKIVLAQSMLTLVPEPTTLLLLGLGMLGLGITRKVWK